MINQKVLASRPYKRFLQTHKLQAGGTNVARSQAQQGRGRVKQVDDSTQQQHSDIIDEFLQQEEEQEQEDKKQQPISAESAFLLPSTMFEDSELQSSLEEQNFDKSSIQKQSSLDKVDKFLKYMPQVLRERAAQERNPQRLRAFSTCTKIAGRDSRKRDTLCESKIFTIDDQSEFGNYQQYYLDGDYDQYSTNCEAKQSLQPQLTDQELTAGIHSNLLGKDENYGNIQQQNKSRARLSESSSKRMVSPHRIQLIYSNSFNLGHTMEKILCLLTKAKERRSEGETKQQRVKDQFPATKRNTLPKRQFAMRGAYINTSNTGKKINLNSSLDAGLSPSSRTREDSSSEGLALQHLIRKYPRQVSNSTSQELQQVSSQQKNFKNGNNNNSNSNNNNSNSSSKKQLPDLTLPQALQKHYMGLCQQRREEAEQNAQWPRLANTLQQVLVQAKNVDLPEFYHCEIARAAFLSRHRNSVAVQQHSQQHQQRNHERKFSEIGVKQCYPSSIEQLSPLAATLNNSITQASTSVAHSQSLFGKANTSKLYKKHSEKAQYQGTKFLAQLEPAALVQSIQDKFYKHRMQKYWHSIISQK